MAGGGALCLRWVRLRLGFVFVWVIVWFVLAWFVLGSIWIKACLGNSKLLEAFDATSTKNPVERCRKCLAKNRDAEMFH